MRRICQLHKASAWPPAFGAVRRSRSRKSTLDRCARTRCGLRCGLRRRRPVMGMFERFDRGAQAGAQAVACSKATTGEEDSADEHKKIPASSAQRQGIPLKNLLSKSWRRAVACIFTKPRRGLEASWNVFSDLAVARGSPVFNDRTKHANRFLAHTTDTINRCNPNVLLTCSPILIKPVLCFQQPCGTYRESSNLARTPLVNELSTSKPNN